MIQNENVNHSYDSKNHKTPLLKKYDIPVEHLEFAYIGKCTNGKELEHILKILKSGEEGHFPDLIKSTENRLKEIKPLSKLLRSIEPVLTKQTLNTDDWNNVSKEIQDWSSEIRKIDSSLQKSKKKISSDIPDIRKVETKEINTNIESNNETKTRIASCDYEGWEKYDPDVELLKQDIEEERYKNEVKKSKELETKKKKSVAFNLNHNLSNDEALILANKEKECGNEYYRIEDYEEAKRFYTKSILMKPTTAAYNNRCATNLKLKKYNEALQDSNSVLKYEPNNVKALIRKAQALHAIGEFPKALSILEKVIFLEPQNDVAQKLINEIQKQLPTKNEKTVRLAIEDYDTNCEENETLLQTKLKDIDLKQNSVQDHLNNYSTCIKLNSDKKLNSLDNVEQNRDIGKGSSEQKTKKVIIPIPSTSSYCGPSIKIVELPVSSNSENKSDKKIVQNDIVQPRKRITEIKSIISEKKPELPIKCIENSNLKSVPKKSIYSNETKSEIDIRENVNLSDPKSCGEPFPQNIYTGPINGPYEFLKAWKSIQNANDINAYARLLRRVLPLNLSLVIGNKLDSEMFSILLKCLEYHFLLPKDVHLVALFMTNVCHLPRFNIVAMFLEESDKIAIRNILSFLQQHGEDLSGDISEMIREYIRYVVVK